MKIRVGHSLFNSSVVTDTFILNNSLWCFCSLNYPPLISSFIYDFYKRASDFILRSQISKRVPIKCKSILFILQTDTITLKTIFGELI
jgi:hypothetical protein